MTTGSRPALALHAPECTDHAYLSAADRCLCLADYVRGGRQRHSSIHQLIVNLKCPPTAAASDPRRGQYKRQAIRAVARALRAAFD
ncbi:MAG: hypothetical protein ACRESY_01365, partial [Steroidobacteraceae bacterium]